ncbi:hypothetical protein C8R43DRAFT_515653, partial [Mycena crocata]
VRRGLLVASTHHFLLSCYQCFEPFTPKLEAVGSTVLGVRLGSQKGCAGASEREIAVDRVLNNGDHPCPGVPVPLSSPPPSPEHVVSTHHIRRRPALSHLHHRAHFPHLRAMLPCRALKTVGAFAGRCACAALSWTSMPCCWPIPPAPGPPPGRSFRNRVQS